MNNEYKPTPFTIDHLVLTLDRGGLVIALLVLAPFIIPLAIVYSIVASIEMVFRGVFRLARELLTPKTPDHESKE